MITRTLLCATTATHLDLAILLSVVATALLAACAPFIA
jgi:hypothetical protein